MEYTHSLAFHGKDGTRHSRVVLSFFLPYRRFEVRIQSTYSVVIRSKSGVNQNKDGSSISAVCDQWAWKGRSLSRGEIRVSTIIS